MRSHGPVVIDVTDMRALVPVQRRTDGLDLDVLMRAEVARLAELDQPFSPETWHTIALLLAAPRWCVSVHHDARNCTAWCTGIRCACASRATSVQLANRETRDAMGIGWMSPAALDEAIPPAYTEHIGRQALRLPAGAA
jgi:hypothetical protein